MLDAVGISTTTVPQVPQGHNLGLIDLTAEDSEPGGAGGPAAAGGSHEVIDLTGD